MEIQQETLDKLLDLYFNKPNVLYKHLFDSYEIFIEEYIPYILQQESNIFYENITKERIYRHCFICNDIRIKQAVFENNNEIKYPHDSRINHLSYFCAVVANVKQYVDIINITDNSKERKYLHESEKNYQIASIPIMVKSKYCSTNINSNYTNECKYDPGGYFIVNGQEKVIMSMEKMVDNKLLVFTKKDVTYPNNFIYTAHINSRKNDWSDNMQILTIKNKRDGVLIANTSLQLIEINIIILLRALGIESDQEIVKYITYDINDIKLTNLLKVSFSKAVDDFNNKILTQQDAINFLISKIKKIKFIFNENDENVNIKKKVFIDKILQKDLLPHLNTTSTIKKAIYICYMINSLLNVMVNNTIPDDRDALDNKRIETPGVLLGKLFRQNWKKMLNDIRKNFKKRNQSDEKPINVIGQIKSSTIEQGIKSALSTGIWGMNKSNRGVAQSLQRLSWNQSISYLRRILSPTMDESTSKVISIRQVNNNQCQMLCCVETPEGSKIGIVKSLAMTSTITNQNINQYDILLKLLDSINKDNKIKNIENINPLDMKKYVKLFLNGNWYGVILIKNAYDIYLQLIDMKRKNIIDRYTSILFNYQEKDIKIYYDGGRLIRPLLIVNNSEFNINKDCIEYINKEYELLDKSKSFINLIDKYTNIIEYEDIETLNYLVVSHNLNNLKQNYKFKNNFTNTDNIVNRYDDHRWINYTHCDFHEWTMLGSIVINMPFINYNAGTKNITYFSYAKQSMGIYLSSYKKRMDISQILYHSQVSLVVTKGMKYNSGMDLPSGENIYMAICSYNGYNQEDSMIFCKSSVDRGLFRADTLKKYHSEITKNPSTSQDDIFCKPNKNEVTGIKNGNYEKLNNEGFVPEETEIDNDDVIIGKLSPINPIENNKILKDSSEIFKSNVKGVVDKVNNKIYSNEGYEMIDMRVRVERKPMIGDKFCCYDDTHEVLTFEGWKNIKDITVYDKVACMLNNILAYRNPTNIQKYNYSGKMYLIDTNDISLCVTPNHRMYVSNDEYNNYEIELAENIFNKKRKYKRHIENIEFIENNIYFIYNNNNITHFKNNDKRIEILDWLNIFCNNYNNGNTVFSNWIWFLPSKLCKYIISKINIKLNNINILNDNNNDLNNLIRLYFHAGYLINDTYINDEIIEDKYIDVNNINIYCCSVEGDGIIYVKRNNLSVWCGNSRCGQKGTIGILYEQYDMPFTESGIVPDVILNNLAFPKRMTVSQFLDILCSKLAALKCQTIDGTPFEEYDIDALCEELRQCGISKYGTETMYCGLTGKKMEAQIFIGPAYFSRLKHLVADKIHGRARGPRQSLTRQPMEGRSRDGGLKSGEMERDSMIAHGTSQFLKERLMESSDITKVYICDICSMFVGKAINKDYYICKGCHNTTKISAVVIPYACKLLFQELQSINILPRFNIEQTPYSIEI